MKNYYSVVVLTYDMPVTSVSFDDENIALRVAQTLYITRVDDRISIRVYQGSAEKFYQLEEIVTYGSEKKGLEDIYKESAYRSLVVTFWDNETIHECILEDFEKI